MKTYIAILRGINVGGHNPLKMSALQELFKGLGFKNVFTYIQSGNVVFEDDQYNCKQLEVRISTKIRDNFSLVVPVIIKTREELIVVFQNNPFVKNKMEMDKLHVTFLSDRPDKTELNPIPGGFGNDGFEFGDRAIYLYCPNGYGQSKLSNQFLERQLKVTATTRNWKTLAELVKISNNKLQ